MSRQLTALAAAFIVLQGFVLTLAPAARERTWSTPLRYSHWAGIVVWLVALLALQYLHERRPSGDPYIMPICGLLAGWGLLTIWRLDAAFGLRQAAWVCISVVTVAWLGARWGDLAVLRRYRSLLLAAGLVLTALTIVLGTSPTGVGPRLWLGCCGIYLQPSEPLKLLMVVYLAAYLGDQVDPKGRLFPMLIPTLVIAALALVLLLVQRDLGNASILIMLFTIILYTATGRKRVLIVTVLTLAAAAITGYFFIDIVRARLESWINPWLDPSGQSYQIVQSLLAVANGGILGRGLGLGSPGLVPVAHSDFIYTAIVEESGLLGGIALLALYAVLFTRGLMLSLQVSDRFHRLLAAGVTAYLGIQALLIIGGDLRMLPLTGVTLPFVSYGGSSLLTSSIAAAMLVTISNQPVRTAPSTLSRVQLAAIAGILAFGLSGAAFLQGWWSVVRGPDLVLRTDNARRSIADRYVMRGTIFDRNNLAIDQTRGAVGEYTRRYWYPDLSPVIGYTHPVFGQAGLEASLDGYLRGLQGNPVSNLIWQQVVYGTPPAGLDVRLTLDLRLQQIADAALARHRGAVVLMNAGTGEILVMASHPVFDANQLDAIGPTLAAHQNTPLLNRAAQGTFQVHNALLPLIAAAHFDSPELQPLGIYRSMGLADALQIRMPVAQPYLGTGITDTRVSPLQVAVAAAALSNDGVRPAPRMALAVRTPSQGWVVLPPLGQPVQVFSADAAKQAALEYIASDAGLWQWSSSAATEKQTLTWYLGGTQPGSQGTPLVAVVLLEDGDSTAATQIGSNLLTASLNR
ncbi:MAG TPA: FtsW/RodA/SpoVE family cell cycle protein [Anaerolineales bacterium]|nr:FtsW/RodA/SpoVE family cell cycle protein [Anaerolineales bacterium]